MQFNNNKVIMVRGATLFELGDDIAERYADGAEYTWTYETGFVPGDSPLGIKFTDDIFTLVLNTETLDYPCNAQLARLSIRDMFDVAVGRSGLDKTIAQAAQLMASETITKAHKAKVIKTGRVCDTNFLDDYLNGEETLDAFNAACEKYFGQTIRVDEGMIIRKRSRSNNMVIGPSTYRTVR